MKPRYKNFKELKISGKIRLLHFIHFCNKRHPFKNCFSTLSEISYNMHTGVSETMLSQDISNVFYIAIL